MATVPAGEEPVIPMPERAPAAIRASVAGLDPAALARFDAEWADASAQARDEHDVMPVRRFTEKWWLWAAVYRWPVLAARLRECEHRAAEAQNLSAARTASAEIGGILRAAADAAA